MRRPAVSRVLVTADAVGGVWTHALDLSRGLEARGVEVVIATMGPRPSRAQRAEVPRGVHLVESDYRLEWMDDPWVDVDRAGEWLLELEERHAPDVVHLNGYAHGALPFRAPVLVVAHSCVSSWFEAVKGESAPPRFAEYQKRVARGLRGANRVVAISGAMLHAISRHYGWLPSTSVIHNGRDAAAFAPGEKEPFVFAAGRVWDEAKNLRTLERASSKIPWPVYVAGDALEPSPHRLGRLPADQVAAWMARASIYAFPARYEPFGLSVLEAALSGCALVLGDIASLREIWGSAAVFVPPNDVDALARALEALAADEPRRLDLARRARERAGRYELRAMVEAYLSTYAELLEEQPVVSVRDLRCAS